MESNFDSYIGPRVGILSISSKSKYSGSQELKSSETDFFVGVCVGGEYAFSPHFTIGGEAQLNYVSYGEPDITPAPPSPQGGSRSLYTNNALMFIRWYF